jgi:hypothetical protein
MSIPNFFLDPYPLRTLVKALIRRFKIGSYLSRLEIGAVDRPNYAYCLYNGALLAKKLGYSGISVLEFGVAGGQGLSNLEICAEHIRKSLSIDIDIYGFDSGEGLPEPLDYRDLPYHWRKSFYKMDFYKLKKRLKMAKLILGDVKDTCKNFLEKYNPQPIAAIMFDLDFYSSTANALKIFEGDEKHFLPRIFCYFDDVTGSEIEAYNEYTGTRLAINEFNLCHKTKKLAKAYFLLEQKAVEDWYHRIYMFHNFQHSKYNKFISKENQQLPL